MVADLSLMIMLRSCIFTALLLLAGFASAQTITLKECLGYDWPSQVMHRSIACEKPGMLSPGQAMLLRDETSVPAQLANVQTYPDGSVKGADVWFRTDLPANGTRVFTLKNGKGSPASTLKMTRADGVLELSNALTAVRLPDTPNALHGPLLGVRLPSGKWTGPATITADAALETCATEVVAQGPIFIRTRTTYRFAGGGSYLVEVTLREGEPLVRVDERYEKAGRVSFDLGANLQPTHFLTKADFRGNMQRTAISYDKTNQPINLVGWDYHLPNRTATIAFVNEQTDELLGWMSPEDGATAWLPDPYVQTLAVVAELGGTLHADGALANGRRAWMLYVGKGTDFPKGGTDLYRWWTRHVTISLDRVANWQLEWPGMNDITFPHTFFSKDDLPAIRARLQAEPTIKAYIEELRGGDGGIRGWSYTARESGKDREWKARFDAYSAKYRPRGGIAKGTAYISAAYLYYGDRVYLEQLAERDSPLIDDGPEKYLDYLIAIYLDGTGFPGNGSMGVSDALLQQCVALDLLLGGDVLPAADKHRLLVKLAFITYLMHTPEWQPPVHMPDGSRPVGYAQGTPNMKHCAFSCRAMTACMLTGHPMLPEWQRFAMAELRPHYKWTIADSGALLESPFYSARDTMRYTPFWSAMTRAGVAEVAPDYKEWMNRPKRAFAYLADMLTPKEPRMGGRRVYHPIGRSGSGVIDPSFMIGGDPWGLDDPAHAGLMRWAWEQQGKPSADIMGSTGGRNIALTLLAFSQPAQPLANTPLRSRRYEGMGAIFRSHPEGDYESNVLFRHDGFCWDLYPVNNGAVYFYGKGAPLLPRFGAYWSHGHGGAWMMDLPFGNRLEFASGNNNCFGSTTAFATLGPVADYTAGVTDDTHWARAVLFSKDADRDDPVYLLVRDDVSRPDVATSVNWWIMTRNVAPDGLTKSGVVPINITHEDWVRNMGKNWANALKTKPRTPTPADPDAATVEPGAPETMPVLTGQLHHFPGMCGVDVDLFIAAPAEPHILTDAASTGKMVYCQNPALYETQQLVRVSQPAGKPYLTLITPRWPGSASPAYRTIADGDGVAISSPGLEDRLFLGAVPVAYTDAVVKIAARGGFVRKGGPFTLRLMVLDGVITAGGITLTAKEPAALVYDGKAIILYQTKGAKAEVKLAPALRGVKITRVDE